MFSNHIDTIKQKDRDLDNTISEIDRIDWEMVQLSKKITECVLESDIDEERLAEMKYSYTRMKNERDDLRSDLDNIKEEMRKTIRSLDNLIGGIKK